MKKVLILLILISVCKIYCQNERSPRPRAQRLRRFGIFQMRQIREFIRAHEVRQNIQDELMKKKEDEIEEKKNNSKSLWR